MKKIRVTYSWHEDLGAPEKQVSSFEIELEDEQAYDCIRQKAPYSFRFTATRPQYHIAMIAYWHAAAHDRYVLKDDEVLKIEEVEAA